MTDNPESPETAGETTPPQPPQEPVAPTTPPEKPSENWEARYKGLVPTVEKLTLSNREFEGQLEQKNSEIEQLKSQLEIKGIETKATVGERDKALEQTIQEKIALESKVADLEAMQLKLEVAKELKRPELMLILDKLPNLTDREALTVVAKDMLNWSDGMVTQRVNQIQAGVTPPPSGATQTPALPSTSQGWEDHINALPLGSPERAEAMQQFGDWAESPDRLK